MPWAQNTIESFCTGRTRAAQQKRHFNILARDDDDDGVQMRFKSISCPVRSDGG